MDKKLIAEITMLTAEEVRRFGITPKVSLLSHSNFGSFDNASARKMVVAREILKSRVPGLEEEGEMHEDANLSEELRMRFMPNLDAANIAFNLLKMVTGEGVTIRPVLLGAANLVHLLTSSATVCSIVNMSVLALAGVEILT